VEFEQPGVEILNRENVAIIAKLSLKSNPSVQFLVATTHLLYNPRRQDIRLAQVQVLLAELDRHAQVMDENGQKTYLPVILTGDFNLQPTTAPYNLIVHGKIDFFQCHLKQTFQMIQF
jgi:protein angel